MKFKVEKTCLMEGLSFVQKAITGKHALPILEGVYIHAENDKITLRGSDMITTITATIDAKVLETGCIVIDSKMLSDMRKFPDGEIDFSSKDNGIIVIKAGRVNAKFPILEDGKNYPEVKSMDTKKSFSINSKQLIEMIKGTVFATAQDETRPILTGLLFKCLNNEFSIVGLDGYRLAIQKFGLKSENFDLVIPNKSLVDLIKIVPIDVDIEVLYDNNNIIFKFNEVLLQTRLLEGSYLNYEPLIPKDNDVVFEIDSKILKESIERCGIVNKEKNLISLTLEKDSIEISSNTTFGEIQEKIECVSEKELKICFNSKYLLDVCNCLSGILTIKMKTPVTPCLISIKDKDNCIYLVLPVRVVR